MEEKLISIVMGFKKNEWLVNKHIDIEGIISQLVLLKGNESLNGINNKGGIWDIKSFVEKQLAQTNPLNKTFTISFYIAV